MNKKPFKITVNFVRTEDQADLDRRCRLLAKSFVGGRLRKKHAKQNTKQNTNQKKNR